MRILNWLIDGNNVFGSRPDGWWNDRPGATRRFTQAVAEWCWTHDNPVTIVFDPPVPSATLELAGGNLTVMAAQRSGRDAADDTIVDLATAEEADGHRLIVVSSDKGLRQRLDNQQHIELWGAGRFRRLINY